MNKNTDFMRNRHAYFKLKINLVVRTFEHRKIINTSLEKRLLEIINKNFIRQDIKLNEYKFIDRNTLFLSFFISPQTIALSKIVNSLKTSTSRIIKKEFTEYLSKFNIEEGFWEREYTIYT